MPGPGGTGVGESVGQLTAPYFDIWYFYSVPLKVLRVTVCTRTRVGVLTLGPDRL